MPRSTKQNEQMRAATYKAILDSAMSLFAQKGYANTSTRAIAKEAGISAGLLFHYFANKQILVRAVVEQCIARINTTLEPVIEQSSAEMMITKVLRANFDLLASDPAFWSLFNMLRTQPAIMRELGDDFRRWTNDLRNFFASYFKLYGHPEPILDAYVLYSTLEGAIQQFLLEPDSYPLDQVAAHILKKFNLPTE